MNLIPNALFFNKSATYVHVITENNSQSTTLKNLIKSE